MSSYASGAKLTDLKLADEPALGVKSPAAGEGPPPPVARADPNIHRSNHSTVVKAELLRLADEPTISLEIRAVEAGTRARASVAARDRASEDAADLLAEATHEFDAGTVDKALWAKAMDLAGNDSAAAKHGYLRARVAALRATKRAKRVEQTAARARALAQEEKEWIAASPRTRARFRRTTLVAGALGCVVAIVIGYLALRPADNTPPPVASDSPSPIAKAARAKPATAAKSAAVKTGADRPNVTSEDFEAKVQELKAAGNWNVLVLYAVEWTRKTSGNADAWNELGMGYMKLRQFSDALDATTKASQLAPGNVEIWQRLGEINVILQKPAAAIAAYEKAVALKPRDVASHIQIGVQNALLGQLSQARTAFAHALDVSPMDADALCGTAAIAQKEGHQKDVEAIGRQLKAADLRCPESVAAAAVSVAPPSPASKKPVSRSAR